MTPAACTDRATDSRPARRASPSAPPTRPVTMPARSSVVASTHRRSSRPGRGRPGPVHQAPPGEPVVGVGPLVRRPAPGPPQQVGGRTIDGREQHQRLARRRGPPRSSAATWPSPRCSRRHVHQYHRASTGSSGSPVARVAAKSGRPASGTPSSRAAGRARGVRAVAATAGSIRRRAERRRMRPGGPHVAGGGHRPRLGQGPGGPVGWKLKNVAVTSSGPDGPERRGATGEVAHPEAAEPEAVDGGQALRVEVDDGVQRLEAPATSRAGGVALTAPVTGSHRGGAGSARVRRGGRRRRRVASRVSSAPGGEPGTGGRRCARRGRPR